MGKRVVILNNVFDWRPSWIWAPMSQEVPKATRCKKDIVYSYALPNLKDVVNTHVADKMNKDRVTPSFAKLGIKVKQMDTSDVVSSQIKDINNAQAIYMCGGSTFWLTRSIQQPGIADTLRRRINNGIPYVGASAGTNITYPTMQTTNDMPNCCIDSCETLGILPFQLNVHFNDYTYVHQW